MKTHLKAIHEERKFVCEFLIEGQPCNKKYPTRYDLKCHLNNVHFGIKKHKCPDCEQSFSLKKYMENHLRTVHQRLKIQCELCNSLLCDKIYYIRHILKHKEIDEDLKTALIAKIKSTREEDLFNFQK